MNNGFGVSRSHTGTSYSIGERIAGRYEVQGIFGGEGKSAMGTVYKCYDHEHAQVLALKTLQDKFLSSTKVLDSFKKEAFAWIHLGKHPNIVRAYWARELDGHMFVASEFILPDATGRHTLTHYFRSINNLKQVLDWAIQFCYGMEYARLKGVTPHRDVKPDNIMITYDNVLKITDFGLVGIMDKSKEMGEIKGLDKKGSDDLKFLSDSQARMVAGSPPWMAPEQFYGVAEVRSDVYSFGIILYQMVNAGEPPFRPKGRDSWGIAHKKYRVPSVPKFGKPLKDVIKKCLHKRRDKRYGGFDEVRADLERIYAKEITKQTGELPPPPPKSEELKEAGLINKGLSYANLGLVDEGISSYREALKNDPDNAQILYNLGNALAQKSLFDEAIMQYRKAIKIEPWFAEAHYNLGLALVSKGQIDEAAERYKEVIKIKPDFVDPLINLGMIYMRKGLTDKAMDVYSKAIKVSPGSAEAYAKLGTVFFKKGMFNEAVNSYREAIRIRPDYAEALNNLGTALMNIGLVDEAVDAYGRALMKNQRYADAYFNIGIAFIRKSLNREAMQALQEFIKLSRNGDARVEKANDMISRIQSKL